MGLMGSYTRPLVAHRRSASQRVQKQHAKHGTRCRVWRKRKDLSQERKIIDMAYFIWLQFFPISWRNQSTERDNNLHTFMHSESIRTRTSVPRAHPPSLWNERTGDSIILNLLLYVLPCLCLLWLENRSVSNCRSFYSQLHSVHERTHALEFIPWSEVHRRASCESSRPPGRLPEAEVGPVFGTPSTRWGTLTSQGRGCRPGSSWRCVRRWLPHRFESASNANVYFTFFAETQH